MSTPPANAVEHALTTALRDGWPQIIGSLVRILGDVQRAEDCAQDAAVQALRHWRTAGIPAEPRAWLIRASRNRAVDVIRRESRRHDLEHAAARLDPPPEPFAALLEDQSDPSETRNPSNQSNPSERPTDAARGARARPHHASDHDALDDDVLRLVFLCCHPSLAPEVQAALCLRLLAGLTTLEIARAFLVPEATMTKRLLRAKQKIARATIPFTIPKGDELAGRLDGVAATIYLLFNEGYAASDGDTMMRPALTTEALRLGRLVHDLLPGQPTASGLLALMMLHDSRRDARIEGIGPGGGSLVLLRDQDRSLWDASAIQTGVRILGGGLRDSPVDPNPYVVQAAIAACHALAPDWASTDWAAISSWYDVLLRIHDTPIVRLNAAVAIAERDGPAAGLAAVDAIDGLSGYPLWHASRAELLERLGRPAAAGEALAAAAALPCSAALRRHLEKRREQIAAA